MAVQWPLLIFSVLLGISSGMMVFAAAGEIKGRFKDARFILTIAALVLVAVGGCASVFHLGHPERALHILGNINSGLSKELFAVGAMGVATLIYAILSRKSYPSATKVFGILAGAIGIVLPLVAGASYVMSARPVWDSFTLPVMYLGTGLSMGMLAAAAIVCSKGDAADSKFARQLALVGAIAGAVSIVAYVAWIGMAPYPDATRSIDRLISGDLAVYFWGGAVVLGAAVPVVLAALALKKRAGGASDGAAAASEGEAAKPNVSAYMWAAVACSVAGSVAIRVIMYLMATSVEQFIYQ